jgi:hypothetical protein
MQGKVIRDIQTALATSPHDNIVACDSLGGRLTCVSAKHVTEGTAGSESRYNWPR